MDLDIGKIRSRLAWYQVYTIDQVKPRILPGFGLVSMVVVWAFIFGDDARRQAIIARMPKLSFAGRAFDRTLIQSLIDAYHERGKVDETDVQKLYDIASLFELETQRENGEPGDPDLGYGYRMRVDQILSFEPVDDATIDKALGLLEWETTRRELESD